MFVSVGSRSNAGERRIYAPWQSDEGRALVLAFTPEGNNKQLYATGLRNCVGMVVQPATGELWCSVNERDGLGDDLVPDFVTRVREAAFYGWPWFYIGGNEDPRRVGEEPTLRQRVSVADVLLQPHSASMELTVYNGGRFPAATFSRRSTVRGTARGGLATRSSASCSRMASLPENTRIS